MALVGHWKLDGNALDSSGYRNDGSEVGAYSYDSGKIGEAFITDVSAGHINTTFLDKNLISGFSASAWIKIKEWGHTQCVFGTASFPNGWLLWRPDAFEAGLLSFHLYGKNSSDQNITTNRNFTGLTLNEWYHVLVIRGEPGIIKLYLNGVKTVDTTGEFHNFKEWNTGENNTFKIAAGGTSIDFQVTAQMDIDDVRLYDNILSDKEIKELARAKVLHYGFDNFSEPTENLIDPSLTFPNGIGEYSIDPPSSSEGWYKAHGTRTGTNTIIFRLDSYLVPDGDTVTFGIEFRTETGKIRPVITGNVGIFIMVNVYGNKWEYTWTNTAGFDATESINWEYTEGADTTLDETWYYRFYQIEQKPYSTPFVNGTRDGIITDTSSQDNDAPLALSTTPQWISDSVIGKGAYNFDKLYDHIMSNNTYILALREFTYSCWVKTIYNTAFLIIGSRFGNNVYQALGIVSGKLQLRKYIYNNNSDIGIAPSNTSVNDGNWHMLTITYDNGDTKTYVDGQLENSQNHVNSQYNNVPLQINYDSSLSGFETRSFRGSIDDVQIYATTLSEDDIQEIYKARISSDKEGNLFTNGIEEKTTKGIIEAYNYNEKVGEPFNILTSHDDTYSPYMIYNETSNPSAWFEYFFIVPSDGDYDIEGYLHAWSGSNDSFFMSLDGEAFIDWYTTFWVTGEFRWITWQTRTLTAGEHSLRIAPRESTQMSAIRIEGIHQIENNQLEKTGNFLSNEVSEVGSTNGLIGYWPLDEGSGIIAEDIAGENDGTLSGDPTWTTWPAGGAIQFHGDSTNRILSPVRFVVEFTDPWSISAWVYIPASYIWSPGTELGLIGTNITYSGYIGITLATTNEGIRFYARSDPHTSNPIWATIAAVIQRDTWHHIVSTSTGNEASFFLDSVHISTVARPAMIGSPADVDLSLGGRLVAGGSEPSGTRDFNGKIAEPRIYNRALSAQEVNSLYALGSNKKLIKAPSNTYIKRQIFEK